MEAEKGIDGAGGKGKAPPDSLSTRLEQPQLQQPERSYRFDVPLTPGETTIVSWKTLVKDFTKKEKERGLSPPADSAAAGPDSPIKASGSRANSDDYMQVKNPRAKCSGIVDDDNPEHINANEIEEASPQSGDSEVNKGKKRVVDLPDLNLPCEGEELDASGGGTMLETTVVDLNKMVVDVELPTCVDAMDAEPSSIAGKRELPWEICHKAKFARLEQACQGKILRNK